MSVEVYGVNRIRIKAFKGESSIWWDTKTECGDSVNLTIRIPIRSFARQMREALDRLEKAHAMDQDSEYAISIDKVEENNAPRTEAETNRV